MEAIKRRRVGEEEENPMTQLLSHISNMVFQIGGIVEGNARLVSEINEKLNVIYQRIDRLESKVDLVEKSVSKFNGTILTELNRKNEEIAALQKLNQDIMDDCSKKIEILESASSKSSSSNDYFC